MIGTKDDALPNCSTGGGNGGGKLITGSTTMASTTMDLVGVEKAEVKTATLVLLGDKDRICYPKGTKAFFEALGSEDKEYKEYPGRQFNRHFFASVLD